MTYKAHFDQLLLISIQKSNAFLAVDKAEGQSGSSHYMLIQAEWERAENECLAFLELMKSGRINPDKRMTSLTTCVKGFIKETKPLPPGLAVVVKSKARLKHYWFRLTSWMIIQRNLLSSLSTIF